MKKCFCTWQEVHEWNMKWCGLPEIFTPAVVKCRWENEQKLGLHMFYTLLHCFKWLFVDYLAQVRWEDNQKNCILWKLFWHQIFLPKQGNKFTFGILWAFSPIYFGSRGGLHQVRTSCVESCLSLKAFFATSYSFFIHFQSLKTMKMKKMMTTWFCWWRDQGD